MAAPSPRPSVLLAWTAGAVGIGVAAVVAFRHWHLRDAAEGAAGSGAIAVGVAVAGVVLLLVLGGAVRQPGPWLAAAGALVVLAGSGVLRWSESLGPAVNGSGELLADAPVAWPLVAAGLVLVAVAAVLVVRRGDGPRPLAAVGGLATLALGLVLVAATMGPVVVGGYAEGRPRRRRGRLVPTPAPPGGSTGALWAAAAEDEAAAVEAFRTLAHRLDRVGAPAALVARCEAAAADEVRHARRCRALSGADGPSAAPRRPTSAPDRRAGRTTEVVRLAVESFVDGMVGEGAAAGRLERGAATAVATAPERARTLATIARDERAHAALGADVVAWCVARRPVLVPAALHAVARRVPERTALPAAHAAVPAADLRAAGLVDEAGAAAVWAAERERAVADLDAVLAQGRGRGPAQ